MGTTPSFLDGDPSVGVHAVPLKQHDNDQFLTPDMLERCWTELSPQQHIQLPWEQGIWKHVFTTGAKKPNQNQRFLRPMVIPEYVASSLIPDMPVKRQKVSRGPQHSVEVVSTTSPMSWKEAIDVKRWYESLKQFPACYDTVVQLGLLEDIRVQLRMLRGLVADKSPLTLIKRANAMLRYLEYLRGRQVEAPGNEERLYKYVCDQRYEGCSVGKLSRYLQHFYGLLSLSPNVPKCPQMPPMSPPPTSRCCNGWCCGLVPCPLSPNVPMTPPPIP